MSLLSPPSSSDMGASLRFKPRDAMPMPRGYELPTPEERDLMTGLAAWQMRYGQSEEALGILLCCRSLWPQDAKILRLLGQALMEAGEWRKANAIFQEMELALTGPPEAAALLARAVTFLNLRQPSEAVAYYGRYLAASMRRVGLAE